MKLENGENNHEHLPLTPEVQETIAHLEDFETIKSYEKPVITETEEDKERNLTIAKIEAENALTESQKVELKKTPGDEPLDTRVAMENHKSRIGSKARNWTMAALGTLFGFKATAEGKLPTSGPIDSTKNKIESVVKKGDPTEKKGNIAVYPGGKTKEGATTPTGFNNSFFNNEYGVFEGDIESVAKKFGFRTDNVENFQTDMFRYLEKESPEDMKKIMGKYAMPAAGKMVDNILGVRVAFAVSLLKNKIPGGGEKIKESDPYAAFAESGEVIYAPGAGGHAVAEICYPIRNSTSIKDAGGLDASKQSALVRFRNDFGFTGEVVLVTAEELTALIGTTNHFQNQEQLNKLKGGAVSIVKNN